MSNKTLSLTIVALLVVFVAVIFIVRNMQTTTISTNQQNDQYAQSNPSPTPTEAMTPTPTIVTPTNSATATPSSTAQAGTCTRNFDQNKLSTAKVNIQNRIVELDVKDFGKIQLALYDKDAPKAVENFLRLVNAGYYNCLTFHRVAAGFVIQGGDPNGNGSGGESAFGSPFADELDPATTSYKTGYVKGVLAMANSGANTNGSQFFITTHDDTTALQHAYTIFGKVNAGQDVADKIGALPTNPPGDGAPLTPVVITKATIIK